VTTVYGLDGCKGGWCAIRLDIEDDEVRVHDPEILTFADVVATDAAVICIDIPIGLSPDSHKRGCDIEAKRLLGWPRMSSVFLAPARGVIELNLSWENYAVVNAEHRRITGRGLAKQSFAIAPKIKEVDDHMTPTLQKHVREVHPELCFWALAGHPMRHNKKHPEGRDERWALLRDVIPSLGPEPLLPSDIGQPCAMDDYIDAMIAAWTAVCIIRGSATSIPAEPEYDGQGLRMEMWRPEGRA